MKKTIYKVVGTLMLITAMVFTQIPSLGIKASTSNAANGYMLDGNKLVKYTGTDSSVSVPSGVKYISEECFADNTTMTSITLPKTLKEIGNGAFSGCTNLTKVEIPEGVEAIGNGAFADCDNLSSVSLPSTLASLGAGVFAGDACLKSVSISNSNPYFLCYDGILYDDDLTCIYQVLAGREAEEYTMPNSVEEIKKYAFWGTSHLKHVTLSSYLTYIGDYAFSNASGLVAISMPYSVRSIQTKAFEDCRNLSKCDIPPSVTSIAPTAFDGCYIVKIIAEEGSTAAEFYDDFEKNNASRREYEDSLSKNSVNPHKQESSDNANTYTQMYPASDVENYVEWDVDSPGVLGRTKVSSRQAVFLMDASSEKVYGYTTISENDTTQEVAIVDASNALNEEHKILNFAYYKNKDVKQVNLPTATKEIGEFAFARSGLTSISIPYGVTKIDDAAFYHCDDLSSVYIPNSVQDIGMDAFTYSKWLDQWCNGSDVDAFYTVGDGVLIAYKGTESKVAIPSNVKTIGPAVFKNHDEITSVTIPDSVKIIDESAFEDCSNLTNLVGANQVTAIKDRAFMGCPISTIRIPASVKTLGVGCFANNQATDTVVFLGDTLPTLTYEPSSQRLTQTRDLVFGSIKNAIVNTGVTSASAKGSVLDFTKPGFEGIIYTMTDVNSKKVKPLWSNSPESNTTIPDSIVLYGSNYKVEESSTMEYASSKGTVSDNSIQGLSVVDHSDLKRKNVLLSNNGSSVDVTGYHFYLSDVANDQGLVDKVIATYGGSNQDFYLMDLSMYDPSDTIPITNLGNQPLNISIPVPYEMMDQELCVVTLDENQNPEVIFPEWTVVDQVTYLNFDINHFSPYAIYVANGALKDQITTKKEQSKYSALLDITPDTSDRSPVGKALVIGFGAIGAFLLLLGFKPKKES